MSTTALRPRSVTEIVDAAFQILRAHYAQFVVCSSIAYVPILILQLTVVGDPSRFLSVDASNAAETLAAFSRAMVLSQLGAWLTRTVMSAVLQVCASQAYLGEEVNVANAVRQALPRLPAVVLAAVIRFILMCVGFLALLVGAIYVFARYFAVTPVIVLEGAGALNAFGRSSALSNGRKGRILNTLGLVALIYWVLVIGITMVASLFGSFIIQTFVSAIAVVLIFPVIAITECLLYYDARIQSEGLDIELMAVELGAAPRTEPVSP
jgi:hypothetical protein